MEIQSLEPRQPQAFRVFIQLHLKRAFVTPLGVYKCSVAFESNARMMKLQIGELNVRSRPGKIDAKYSCQPIAARVRVPKDDASIRLKKPNNWLDPMRPKSCPFVGTESELDVPHVRGLKQVLRSTQVSRAREQASGFLFGKPGFGRHLTGLLK